MMHDTTSPWSAQQRAQLTELAQRLQDDTDSAVAARFEAEWTRIRGLLLNPDLNADDPFLQITARLLLQQLAWQLEVAPERLLSMFYAALVMDAAGWDQP